MERVRYLTKGLLTDLNNQAILVQSENHLSKGTVNRLPSSMRFPVVDHILLNGKVRLEVGLSLSGRTGFIDVSVDDFINLPELECRITEEMLEALGSLLTGGEVCTIH